jgi:predicted permease
MERFLLDLRLALRRLRQNPGFSFIAVLTLALGIGANTAIFSAINAVLLRPLPVERSSELISVNQVIASETVPAISYPDYRDFRDRNNVFSGFVTYRFDAVSLGLPRESQRIWAYLVSGNYFQVLGVNAARGRVLLPEDDSRGGNHSVVVLSYSCWQRRFGGDPGIVGRTIKINGRDFTVLGVTPREFFGTELFFSPEAFFPVSLQQQIEGGSGYLDHRDSFNLFAIGRLKPGITSAQAEAALNGIARQLALEHPKEDGGLKIILTPPGLAGNYVRPAVVGFAAALFGVSALVLLVACTNLVSMLLARAADRRKETAIRLALGAERGRLVRQLLTESLVVALAGGAAGAVLALWITDGLAGWRPPVIDFPLLLNVVPDARVFFFTLLVSLLTTLLFGLLPALQSTRTDLVPALKNEAASEKVRHWHLRDYMVAAQVAMSTLLLVCSVLVVRSLQQALYAPIGYNPNGAVTVSFDLNSEGYDEARGHEFERRLLDRVRELPGIESAALASALPLTLNFDSETIYIEGRPKPKPAEAPTSYNYSVTPDYFRTMQTRLLMGREFDLHDRRDAKHVAVINQAFARQLLPGQNPIGKRFSDGPDTAMIEIVGVAQDGKYISLSEGQRACYWTPLEVVYSANVALVARTKLSPFQALQSIRGAVRDLDPDMALFSTGTLTDQLALPLFPARIAGTALGSFGLLALILAATGIYGVMAYAISRRTREIGIRMAIGARQPQILGLVLRHAMVLIGSGTVVGLIAALVVGRLLSQILYGIQPTDPVTFGIVFLLMLAVATLACWVPARRAILIDPIRALRQE